MRKDALKMYIYALLSEGEFAGMSSPASIAKKAIGIFAKDLPAVLGELAQVAAEQSGNFVQASIIGKINEIIGEVGRRGFKSVWADLQEQYKRGVEANAQRR